MPFAKGQSGNPSGRPKAEGEIRALAQKHTKRAIARLAEWMESNNAKASVAACTVILDRGYGKPAQAISGDLDLNMTIKIVRFGDDNATA